MQRFFCNGQDGVVQTCQTGSDNLLGTKLGYARVFPDEPYDQVFVLFIITDGTDSQIFVFGFFFQDIILDGNSVMFVVWIVAVPM